MLANWMASVVRSKHPLGTQTNACTNRLHSNLYIPNNYTNDYAQLVLSVKAIFITSSIFAHTHNITDTSSQRNTKDNISSTIQTNDSDVSMLAIFIFSILSFLTVVQQSITKVWTFTTN